MKTAELTPANHETDFELDVTELGRASEETLGNVGHHFDGGIGFRLP